MFIVTLIPDLSKPALKDKNSFYITVTFFLLLLSSSIGMYINAAPTTSNNVFNVTMFTLLEFDKDVCSLHEPGVSLSFNLSCFEFFLGKHQFP